MGFNKPALDMVYTAIRHSLAEISSPYNDGFIQMSCKEELYLLKCWLEDRYSQLPTFAGEEKWEQERLLEILKK
jgi:hypothetical protein